MDAGTGKTLSVLRILEEKIKKEGRLLRTLVLTPSVVIETWRREILKYTDIPKTHVITLTGNMGERAFEYNNNPWPAIFITNYEALYSSQFVLTLKKSDLEVMILDESHRIKNSKAKRTKRCLELSEKASLKYKYILTGTAVLNTPMDLFTQFKFLAGEKAFGTTNPYIFRSWHFDDMNRARVGTHSYFPNFVLRPGHEKIIAEQIAPISMRVKKSEALDLPPLIRQTVFCELNDAQKKAYKEMKKDFLTFLGEKACTASIALIKALRLQQIVSGFIRFEDESIKSFDDSPRLAALYELLEDLTPDHKVIVWSVFKENYTQIKKVCVELKVETAEVHGGISDKDAEVQRFNTDPNIKVMIAHPGAGGIGINLIPASYSIWFSRNFSLEQDIQATARNYRGGSEIHSKVTRIDLVAKDTIDEVILDVIKEKTENSDALLDGLQTELLSKIVNGLGD